MRPGKMIRPIEWEVVPRDMARVVGLTAVEVKEYFGDQADLAVVKCVCVDDEGEKLTCIANAQDFKELLASGEASDPQGTALTATGWPVVLRGWLQAG